MSNIPKKIHYCWMGGNDKSDLVKSCIQSWKDKLDDYEIIEWNETNFPIEQIDNDFVKEAYKAGKWAFVSDYVRLWALINEGGIYLDTDVEIVGNIDFLLNNEAFIGFEDEITLASCVIGAAPQNEFIAEILEAYSNLKYSQNLAPNVKLITDIAVTRGLQLNGKVQQIKNNVMIYSRDYFSPKSYITGEIESSNKTVCIHHFDGSWLTKESTVKNKIKVYFYKTLGSKIYNKIVLIKRKFIR